MKPQTLLKIGDQIPAVFKQHLDYLVGQTKI